MSLTNTDTHSRQAESSEEVARLTSACLYLCMECDRPLAGGVRYVLDGVDEIVVGRGSARTAEIVTEKGKRRLFIGLPDTCISSRHALISRRDGAWLLSDTNSKNGVFLAKQKIQSAPLLDGSIFELGHSIFVFRRAVLVGEDTRTMLDSESLLESEGAEQLTLNHTLASQQRRAERLFAAGVPLLIQGESGTGKECFARALHESSGRPGPLIAINCGALLATLLESELFGYKRGAFSGANEDRKGLIRASDRGTLFLDEIADLPLPAQAALLRVLQEREVLPVGATQAVPVDLRVIAATHQDVQSLVARGAFRQDLFARLAGGIVNLPRLSERLEDLGVIAASILRRTPGDNAQKRRFALSAAHALLSFPWPMNIRELEHSLTNACAVANGDTLALENLPAKLRTGTRREEHDSTPDWMSKLTAEDLKTRQRLIRMLEQTGGNVSEVARQMGKARTQIQRWIRRYRIE